METCKNNISKDNIHIKNSFKTDGYFSMTYCIDHCSEVPRRYDGKCAYLFWLLCFSLFMELKMQHFRESGEAAVMYMQYVIVIP